MQDNQPTGSTQTATPPPNLNPGSPAEIFELFKYIVTKPREFFPTMPVEGGFQQPIMFYLIIAGVNSVFYMIFNLFHIGAAIGGGIAAFIFMMIGSFVGSAITMAISKMMGGTGNYEATYRSCCYAAAPQILSFIPLVNILASLYSIFLLKLALERGQNLTSQKAIYVVAIQVGLGILLALIGLGLAMMLGMAAFMAAGGHH